MVRRSDAWRRCVAWVEEAGGSVGPISYDGAVRASSDLEASQLVLSIPLRCCISTNDVQSSAVGCAAAAAASGAALSGTLSASDLALAFHLAAEASRPKHSFHAAFLALLPRLGGTDEEDDPRAMLPRSWTSAEVRALLGGSVATITAAKASRAAIRADYDAISHHVTGFNQQAVDGWPRFERFDWACSIVTSRAFELSTPAGETIDALVPLADMLDHARPRQTTYRLVDGGVSGNGSLSLEMRALVALQAGSEVHDTYGAKGSSLLLCQYGFALVCNLEPDGSSNDVRPLELPARNDGEVAPSLVYRPPALAPLRIGPKSYSFPPLVVAIDAFRAAAAAGTGAGAGAGASALSAQAGKAEARLAAKLTLEASALRDLAAALDSELSTYSMGEQQALEALHGKPPPLPPLRHEEEEAAAALRARRWEQRAAGAAALVLSERYTLSFYAKIVARCLAVVEATGAEEEEEEEEGSSAAASSVRTLDERRRLRASSLSREVAHAKRASEAEAERAWGDDVATQVERLRWHASDAPAAPIALAYLQIRLPELLLAPARKGQAQAQGAGSKAAHKKKGPSARGGEGGADGERKRVRKRVRE